MESDSSEDEYEPLTISSWGDQNQQNTPTSETNELTGPKSWNSLVDPSVKIKAGALGSGGLHRKGKNYIPVDEEAILKQRLKGGALPKGENKKRAPKNKTSVGNKNDSKDKNKPSHLSTSTSTNSSIRQNNKKIPTTIPTTIRRPPPTSTNSGWGTQPLIETPFWEQQDQPLSQPQSRGKQTLNVPSSWMTDTFEAPSPPPPKRVGFDSSRTTKRTPPSSTTSTKTMTTPPGFGSIPQRRYPVASENPQLPPPPGFDYALPSSTSQQQKQDSWSTDNNNGTSWNTISGDNGGKKKDNNQLDWVSGWDDITTSFASSVNVSDRTKFSKSSSTGKTQQQQQDDQWNIENENWVSDGQETFTKQRSSPSFMDEQTSSTGRFSDPYRNKYSSAEQTSSRPLPRNYYRQNGISRPAFMERPSKAADPPPSQNPIVVSIHLDMENGVKIPVDIRKFDDPDTLAHEFCKSHSITAPNLMQAIRTLFTSQKAAAMTRYSRKR